MGESPRPAAEKSPTIEETVENLGQTVSTLRRVVWMGAFVIGAMLIYIVVLQLQVSGINGQLDDIKTQTTRIDGFVDDLKQEREAGEGVSMDELRGVFTMIRDQLTLLCNQYPDDPVCLQG